MNTKTTKVLPILAVLVLVLIIVNLYLLVENYNRTANKSLIGNQFTNSTENQSGKDDLCSMTSTPTEIGADVYPIEDKYKHLGFLGQIFTAAKCGEKRLLETNDGKEDYDQGVSITLKKSPSQFFLYTLNHMGFSCVSGASQGNCQRWHLKKGVKINELLKLEPFAEDIQADDCVICG